MLSHGTGPGGEGGGREGWEERFFFFSSQKIMKIKCRMTQNGQQIREWAWRPYLCSPLGVGVLPRGELSCDLHHYGSSGLVTTPGSQAVFIRGGESIPESVLIEKRCGGAHGEKEGKGEGGKREGGRQRIIPTKL